MLIRSRLFFCCCDGWYWTFSKATVQTKRPPAVHNLLCVCVEKVQLEWCYWQVLISSEMHLDIIGQSLVWVKCNYQIIFSGGKLILFFFPVYWWWNCLSLLEVWRNRQMFVTENTWHVWQKKQKNFKLFKPHEWLIQAPGGYTGDFVLSSMKDLLSNVCNRMPEDWHFLCFESSLLFLL